jgi:hypothetical protein
MNSGLTGALGTAPLQTVKMRIGNSQGRSHVQIPLSPGYALVLGRPVRATGNTGFASFRRGAGAVDFQTSSSVGINVASGTGSFLAGTNDCRASAANSAVVGGFQNYATGSESLGIGGNTNTISGQWSVAGGFSCAASGERAFAFGNRVTASAQASSAFGSRAVAHGLSMMAHACGSIANTIGGAQRTWQTASGRTIGAVSQTLHPAGEAYSTSNYISIPSGKAVNFLIRVIGVISDGSATAEYWRKVTIKNVGGTTSLAGSVETIGTDVASGTAISITADDTNDALNIEMTGVADQTWRWLATLEGAEIIYAA